MLDHVFVAAPEEELFPAVVQEGDRAACVTAHVVIILGGVGQALAMGICILGIEVAVASVQITFAVILRPAALAEGLEDDRPFSVFRAVGRHQNLNFGNHVLIDIRNLGSRVAGIDQVSTVQHVSHRAVRLGAVRRISAHRPVVRADHLVVETGALAESISQRHSGHELQQFASVAALERNVFHHLGVHGGADFGGVDGNHCIRACDHLNRLGSGAPDRQIDIRQCPVVTLGKHNAAFLPSFEALGGNSHGVTARLHRGDREESRTVRDRCTNVPRSLILHGHFGIRDDRAALIVGRAVQRSG